MTKLCKPWLILIRSTIIRVNCCAAAAKAEHSQRISNLNVKQGTPGLHEPY